MAPVIVATIAWGHGFFVGGTQSYRIVWVANIDEITLFFPSGPLGHCFSILSDVNIVLQGGYKFLYSHLTFFINIWNKQKSNIFSRR
jgi:hypothetical protein